MPLVGTVTSVLTENAGTHLAADVAAAATEIQVDSVAVFPPTGTVRLQGFDSSGDEVTEDVAYSAVDATTLTITLDAGLDNAYDADTVVYLVPLAPVTWAVVDYDELSEPIAAFVPEAFRSTYKNAFAEGDYQPGHGAEVTVDTVAGQHTIVRVIRVPSELDTVALDGEINASQNPIVVTSPTGETTRLDGDSFRTETDDPLLEWSLSTLASRIMLHADGWSVVTFLDGRVCRLNNEGMVDWTATSRYLGTIGRDGNVWVHDPAGDRLQKLNPTTGVAISNHSLSALPSAGDSITYLAVDSAGNYYCTSGANIYKNNSGTAFLTGTVYGVGILSDDDLLVNDNDTEIRRYTSGGVEVTTGGYPFTPPFLPVSIDVGPDDEIVISHQNIASELGGSVYAADFSSSRWIEIDTSWEVHQAFAWNGERFAALRFYDAVASGGYPSLWLDGGVSGKWDAQTGDLTTYRLTVKPRVLSSSQQQGLSADVTPSGTTNSALTFAQKFTIRSRGGWDVFHAYIDAYVSITTDGQQNIIECLVDGNVLDGQLITQAPTATTRGTYSKRWRITGLAAGLHEITFRTRNSAAGTGATIGNTHTAAGWWWSQ